MSELKVQQRKFIVKVGMTADDVKNSKDATAMQRKYASAFDTDGVKGFSQKEADLFNATTFSEKADGSVIFWTRQKDGTKKRTIFNSKDNNIKFKSNDEVKPYVKKAAPKKEESVSFFDEAWSGHQIARLTGDNAFTDWLQNKDKVCTDGKDDGKLSIEEYAWNFAKGLIGGIPKTVINHPLGTTGAFGAGAAATYATGGAILPVLTAIGIVTGVGMTGYGAYKAVTAKTDGEAKMASENCGMGVITTVLSIVAADKALEEAAEAGVKSAQISEDAGIIDKTFQIFKVIPECLTKSKEWASYKLFGTPITIERPNGTVQVRANGQLVEETLPNETKITYENGILKEETLPNGTKITYENGILKEEIFDNGGYRKYDVSGKNVIEELVISKNKKALYKKGILKEETLADGTKNAYYSKYKGMEGNLKVTTLKDDTETVIDITTGKKLFGTFTEGDKTCTYSRGYLMEEIFADGRKIKYEHYSGYYGNHTRAIHSDGKIFDYYHEEYNGVKGQFTKTTLKDGTYKVTDDKTGILVETKLSDGKIYDGKGNLKLKTNHTAQRTSHNGTIGSQSMSELDKCRTLRDFEEYAMHNYPGQDWKKLGYEFLMSSSYSPYH